MSPKSAFSTLQVILIIDLIVVASAAAGYYYVSSLPPPTLSSNQIQLTGLQVTPPTAQVGQPVKTSINITNLAGLEGTYTINLILDSNQNQAQTVTLTPSETKTIEFTITSSNEGVHVVEIENLQGSFILTSLITLSDLAVNRTEAQVGEPIGITAKVTNNAQEPQAYSFTLSINDSPRQTKTGQLNPQETTTILFEVSEQTTGSYTFKVGALQGTFTVTTQAEPPKPAEFQVTDLKTNPSVTTPGTTVTVSAQVTNIGELRGTFIADFTVNGQIRETKTVELSGGETQTLTFTLTGTSKGTYNVAIGAATGSFTVQEPGQIELTNLVVSPAEVWGGQTVTVSVRATNKGSSVSSLEINLKVNNQVVATRTINLAPGTFISVSLTTVAPTLPAGDSMKHVVDVNGIRGSFVVVKDGFHTLNVDIAPSGDADFTITQPGGAVTQHVTPYSAILPTGSYTVTMPPADPTGKATFLYWEDRSTSTSKTISLNSKVDLIAVYSRGSSCPSLFIWNGTSYTFISDVSNHGWLGYIKHINEDGSIIYYRNDPWDYIPLDSSQLKLTDGNYNLTLVQRWNEIFYLDQAYMVVVDHPANVNVYSTMVEEYLDPNYVGKIYTIDSNPLTPVSAFNEKGENVLPQILKIDDFFTNGTHGIQSEKWNNIDWNRITLNLGDLTGAPEIRMVVRAVVDWGSPEDYTTWLNKFFEQPVPDGTEVTPPPYMEVKDENGNWVRVPQSRDFPLPPDGTPRTYVIDLTGLFPTGDYSLRINNFWNVTFDYIAVDINPQQSATIQRIDPQAYLYQNFTAGTTAATGNFTRYGNVTQLVLTEDDMFVIGRQGDAVSLQFRTDNLTPLEAGMVRDYFLFESCWFKDEEGNWGFGFGFTVDPLPFLDMSGFPYLPSESYPNDTAHQGYLQEWNTREILLSASPQSFEFPIIALPIALIVAVMVYANFKAGVFKSLNLNRTKRT